MHLRPPRRLSKRALQSVGLKEVPPTHYVWVFCPACKASWAVDISTTRPRRQWWLCHNGCNVPKRLGAADMRSSISPKGGTNVST
jgi:hypothetical protein